MGLTFFYSIAKDVTECHVGEFLLRNDTEAEQYSVSVKSRSVCYAKTSLIVPENKTAFRKEGHLLLGKRLPKKKVLR